MPEVLASRGVRVGRVLFRRVVLAGLLGFLHLVPFPMHPVEVMADDAGAILEALRIPLKEAVAEAPRRL